MGTLPAAKPAGGAGIASTGTMVLMVGLPSCGKSTTSRAITPPDGVRIEFDEFFYTQVGSNPNSYDWSRTLLPEARRWNYRRIVDAVDARIDPIVIDSDNGLYPYTASYVSYAVDRGYEIELREPDSPWWSAVRRLLEDPQRNAVALEKWVNKLAFMSRRMHRVPVETFRRRIATWKPDLSVQDVLNLPNTWSEIDD